MSDGLVGNAIISATNPHWILVEGDIREFAEVVTGHLGSNFNCGKGLSVLIHQQILLDVKEGDIRKHR